VEDSIIHIELVFRQYHKSLCNLSNNIVRDRQAAEDIVQDVFLNLWKIRKEIDLTKSIKSYLYRSTTNGSINWLNKNKKLISESQVPENQKTAESPYNAENNINAQELELKIKNAIDKLPPKCKAIFVLSRYEGLKYKQIAEGLNISVKTVENQMCIALEKIRKDLEPYITDEFLGILCLTAILVLIF
jgi:RNA polymerase sigma-70 factor, ECF subfamily